MPRRESAIQINVVLSPAQKEKLIRLASASERSMNGWIRYMIDHTEPE